MQETSSILVAHSFFSTAMQHSTSTSHNLPKLCSANETATTDNRFVPQKRRHAMSPNRQAEN